MTPDYFASEEVLDLQAVLAALNDRQSREIIETLHGESKTASELARELTIPLSSLYRKLSTLADASLLKTTIDIRISGKHATRYSVAFDSVTVDLDNQGVEIDIARPNSPTA